MATTRLLQAKPQSQTGAGARSPPEPDPACRGFAATLHQEQTGDRVPSVVQRALARRQTQPGMSDAREVVVASL
jgi:hypothetical protein